MRRIPKDKLELIVKESLSFNEVLRRLGYSCSGPRHSSIRDLIRQHGISTEHFAAMPPSVVRHSKETLFVKNSKTSRNVVKRFIIKNKVLPYVCNICNMEPFWNGKKMVLILDHIDGDGINNELTNLRFLCPNCNSQTETFAGRNVGRNKRVIDRSFDEKRKEIFFSKCNNKNEILEKKGSKKEETEKTPLEVETKIKKIDNISISRTLIKKDRDNELKSELLNLLSIYRNLSFVGRVLGVSDNAVKKRCKKLNIDYKLFFKLEHLSKEIVEEYLKLGNINKTARRFKTSVITVRKILDKNNVQIINPSKTLTDNEKKNLLELIREGKKIREIVKIMKISDSTVKDYKRKYKARGLI